MTRRRKSTYAQRCWQMVGTAALLVGSAVLLHAGMHLLFTLALGGR